MKDWDDDGNGVGGNGKEQANSCGLNGGGGVQKRRHCIPRRSLQDINFEASHCRNTGDRFTGVNEARKCKYILGAFRTPLKRQISRRTEET